MRQNYYYDIPLNSKKEMEKQERVVSANCNGIEVIRWQDNSVITVARKLSPMTMALPMTRVTRWSAAHKKQISINCPNTVCLYNESTGGCDLHDQFHCMYEIGEKLDSLSYNNDSQFIGIRDKK